MDMKETTLLSLTLKWQDALEVSMMGTHGNASSLNYSQYLPFINESDSF